MNTNQYHIWVVSPPNYNHTHAFDEIVLSLESGFKSLGFNCPIHRGTQPLHTTPIIIGGNLLHAVPPVKLQSNFIVYNLEQIFYGSEWLHSHYLNALKTCKVWDYSLQNINNLSKMGIHNVAYVPIGWVPELEKIPFIDKKEYDVLFIGSLTERRNKILDNISKLGLHVERKFNLYESERDKELAKAKIILNIHAYEAKVFEIVRVSYMLANKLFVISEVGNDLKLENNFSDALIFGKVDEIPSLCYKYSKDEEKRLKIATLGQGIFKSMPIVPILKSALNLK